MKLYKMLEDISKCLNFGNTFGPKDSKSIDVQKGWNC